MKNISGGMHDHLDQEVTTLCTCWKIVRVDGVSLTLTDHDQDLVIDGETYLASGGYERSAFSTDAALNVDNVEIGGYLDSDHITAEDLRVGRYDYASVEIFVVNWQDISLGRIKIRRGWFGECIVTPTGGFKVELRGLASLLQNNFGEAITPECRADFGDERCKFPVVPPFRLPKMSLRAGDLVRLPPPGGTNATVQTPLDNLSFDEDGGLGAGYRPDLPGWTTASGRFVLQSEVQGFTAADGGFWAEGYDVDNECYQTFTFAALGIPSTHIDLGVVAMDAQALHCVRGPNSSTQVRVGFLNAAGDEIQAWDTGLMRGLTTNVWVRNQVLAYRVPRGARSVKVSARWHKDVVTGQNDMGVQAGLDGLQVSIYDQGQHASGSRDAMNNVYRVIQGGTTSTEASVTYPTTLESVFKDGTATLQTIITGYVLTSAVSKVNVGNGFGDASGRSFVVDPVDITVNTPTTGGDMQKYPDGWFYNGTVTWLTGANRGFTQELMSDTLYKNGTLSLQYRPPYAIQVGDIFTVRAGCRKDVDMCTIKYSNIFNFRGEPHVPGTDFFLTASGS